MPTVIASPGAPGRIHRRVAIALAFAAAWWLAVSIVNPLVDHPVGYDTGGSVLYFQRLTHHLVLEAALAATPKPAMTAIDGVLYRVGGWAAISLVATVVFAAVASGAAILAWQLAGSAAALFAYVAVIGTRALVLDASLAYAVGWAALWLIVAGLAMNATRPRYLIAALALFLAVLTRLETIVLVVGIGCALVLATTVGRRIGIARPPNRAWLLLASLLAVPVMLIHDTLLTGNPLYWLSVSADFSAAHPASVRDPGSLAGWLLLRYLPMAVLLTLAVGGVLALWLRDRRAFAFALTMLGPGVILFMFLLSSRGTYVSDRYLFLPDLAFAFSAGVGITAVRLATRQPRRRRAEGVAAATAVVGIALGAGGFFAPLDPAVVSQVSAQRTQSANLVAAEPVIRPNLSAVPTRVGAPPRLVVPALLAPIATVDLDLTVPDVDELRLMPDGSLDPLRLRDGQVIYHDSTVDPEVAATAQLELGRPFSVGRFTLEPLAARPDAGWWVYAVNAAVSP